MKLVKPEKLNLLTHKELNEAWVQKIIADDPSILGLGDLRLKGKERRQPKAGRLDLLLQDAESKRYEVEIQLGKIDESHIIRTIEYWDIERKRYPQYDHCAVIIAEDITRRFLNVIGFFNGFIPLIAIQMSAYQLSDNEVSLIFTTVLDEVNLGLVEEDEETNEVTDRNYWETIKGTKQTVALADTLLEIVKEFSPKCELKYNKYYIGLAKDGQVNNFVTFRAKKSSMLLGIRLKQSPEIQEKLDDAKLDTMDYDSKRMRYRIIVGKNDIAKNKELLKELMMQSYGVVADENI